MPFSESFWERLDELVASARVVVERPRGTAHPRFPELIYPLDYGSLAGTSGDDGQAVDVWLGSLPEQRVEAVVCTVDVAKNDVETKLLLGCTWEEMETILQFHNTGTQSATLIEREVPF